MQLEFTIMWVLETENQAEEAEVFDNSGFATAAAAAAGANGANPKGPDVSREEGVAPAGCNRDSFSSMKSQSSPRYEGPRGRFVVRSMVRAWLIFASASHSSNVLMRLLPQRRPPRLLLPPLLLLLLTCGYV